MTEEYDVIVVGGSNAGGVAAAAAAEKGGKVLVIDKESNSSFLFRNTIASLNSKAQQKAGIKINKWELLDYLELFNQDHVDQRLLSLWADQSGAVMDWLDEKVLQPNGAHLYAEKDAYSETLTNKAFPTGNEVTKNERERDRGWGRYVMEFDQKLGVDFKYLTRLEHLVTNQENRVVGVEVTDLTNNQVYQIKAKRGVILCTGGYGADRALMQKWNPSGLSTNVYAQSPRNNGSGILAAMEVGAVKDDQPASIVFDRGGVFVGTNAKTFYDQSDWRVKGYLVLGSYPLLKVNLNGERFFNESAPYQFAMNSLTKQPGNLEVMIWNEETMKHLDQFHTLGCSRLGWPGILDEAGQRAKVEEKLKQGYIQKADSIEELAAKMHLPKDKLVKTVKRYNQMCAQGEDTDYGKEKYRLFPVDKAPYYAVTLGGVLLDTLDGLSVNTEMNVLNEKREAIPGLYAAGNCAGGFFWGSYPDRVPGLTASHAIVFGRLAGLNIMK
ncbi:FAD-dependent oxidoreductase [Lactobacillus xujianguonis]|uniref:FAD-dependent oxidoreductase n=1 Tax=Lactobacillus xujianguonis TaxID=2495899 RepID=UPI000FDA09A3|nr:FAD-dependent oxidoreductase [Lactobacillus xujianguonis]RVU71916.1 FAD-dependent oxidoreductase [Lactobacillus xujianguonis]